MVDLLAHVLIGYGVFTLLARRGYVQSHHVPVGMLGSALPDLAKARLIVPASAAESVLGAPFSWLAIHRLGGLLALAGIGALVVARAERRAAFAALAGGGVGHLVLDAFVARAGGRAPAYLYPFSWWQPPSGDLYVSSDLWPLLAAGAFAALAHLAARRSNPR
jgi:hypothetical protein